MARVEQRDGSLVAARCAPADGGEGEANFGFDLDHGVLWSQVPLGAYAGTSPWGLFDVAGATSEWTEEIIQFSPDQFRVRVHEGSYWGSSTGAGRVDRIDGYGDDFPSISTFDYGFRIASAVPSPGMSAYGVLVLSLGLRRTRRSPWEELAPAG